MADDLITGMSLRDVRKLLDDKSPGEPAFDALDTLLGMLIALAPAALGPAGLALWPLLEPKGELVAGLRKIVGRFTKAQPRDYLEQARNMAAANCLLTHTAFFDALGERLPGLVGQWKLSEADKWLIASAAGQRPGAGAGLDTPGLVGEVIDVPRAAEGGRLPSAILDFYAEIAYLLHTRLRGLDAFEALTKGERRKLSAVLNFEIPSLAREIYDAEYLGLAADFPRFFVWSVLRDQRQKDTLIAGVGADVLTQFELVGRALHGVDLGLERLSAAVAAQPAAARLSPRDPGIGAWAAELHRAYLADIGQPVIDDRYQGQGPGLAYPTRAESYVPQAYRVTEYAGADAHLEREDAWEELPVHDDLGPFLIRHLESPYSVRTPLLILGHPGSGKSLLTRVLAARLAYPAYTAVRVELRDVNPDTDIQAQVEAQIRKDTGRDVNWADFAANLAMSPPVVILDGYDELLQATGNLFATYLDEVRRFQHREAVQGRPVRVIVTSRITLIDKAVVPPGALIVRLEPFDAPRRGAWTAVWNACNAGYFRQARVAPFRPPDSEPLAQLAEQPLLLLMLALYDSQANELSSRPDLDQTLLYYALLVRFIERELTKGKSGPEFLHLPEQERRAVLDRELERLGVAAVGMFNRQALHIRREELNADLRYFAAETAPGSGAGGPTGSAGGRRLSEADLLLGSFFFIHESRSRLAEPGPGEPGEDGSAVVGPAAFEFLHNTFGEFLAADFILRKVLAEASAICSLSSEAVLGDTLRQRLAQMSRTWFACLIHTPLHTRPNVLRLLREWSAHRLAAPPGPAAAVLPEPRQRSRTEIVGALDTIVVTQLRTLLTSPVLPALAVGDPDGQGGAPYRQLPALGHLAVYSLNLVLLRTYLSTDPPCVLDESSLGEQPGGIRAWDRLAGLWRSWFPLESLEALAQLLHATREENRVSVRPGWSELLAPGGSRLNAAYNVAVALADDLAAASYGLHVARIPGLPEETVRALRAKAQAGEAVTLAWIADATLSRTSHEPAASLPVFSDMPDPDEQSSLTWPAAVIFEDQAFSPLVQEFAEVADRLAVTPRLIARLPKVLLSKLAEFRRLSRYEAELAVRSRVERESGWLPDLLGIGDLEPYRGDTRTAWRDLLRSPAAAPVLQAAWRHLPVSQCAQVAALVDRAWPDPAVRLFDVDTAAAIALLARRGGAGSLRTRAIEATLDGCERGEWDMLDLSVELWGGLARLFSSDEWRFAEYRRRFAALAEAAIAEIREQAPHSDLPARLRGVLRAR